MDTARRYRLFAEYEAHGNSRCYELWCLGIAGDPDLVELIEQLPAHKRQPNLVLAAARYLGAAESSFPQFRDWIHAHWDEVRRVAQAHSTQTNEAGRAAVLLPVLAQLRGPLSLIEVGASAGLCLYPDKFSYRYTRNSGEPVRAIDPVCGPSTVVLPCTVTDNVPLPSALPVVVHRSGVDLHPLDVTDHEHMLWLESLVWPGQNHRLQRLRRAADIVRSDPPQLATGDLCDTVADLVTAAPAGSTVVVFGSAVLNYLEPTARRAFEQAVRDLPCHWITNEGRGVAQSVAQQLPTSPSDTRFRFVVALDGRPLAYAGGHGQSLDWFGSW